MPGIEPVVCQHPQVGDFDALADRTDAQVEAIAVAEPDDPLGNKPLIVVTAVKDAQAGWLPLQAEMLTLSTNSVQRVAQNATHTSLTEDKAEAVGISGKAILDVVAAVRSGTPPTQ